jgi:outer membrane protein TolC
MRTLHITFCAVALALTVSARAESLEKRNWSLQDCIQQALEHNLGLRIARYSPEIALNSLSGAYGAYDPTFRVSGQRDYDKAGSHSVA